MSSREFASDGVASRPRPDRDEKALVDAAEGKIDTAWLGISQDTLSTWRSRGRKASEDTAAGSSLKRIGSFRRKGSEESIVAPKEDARNL